MAVIRFRQRVVSKAVSLHSTVFYSRLTNTSTALFASSLAVCGQFQTADIKKYRHEKEIVRQCHGFNVKYHLSILPIAKIPYQITNQFKEKESFRK